MYADAQSYPTIPEAVTPLAACAAWAEAFVAAPADAAVAEEALRRAKQQIRAYAASARASDLLLPPCFNGAEREQLHNLAADLKLEHTTVGVFSDAQLVVHKWRRLACFTAGVGADAHGRRGSSV